MKFNKTTTISIGSQTRPIFESFEQIRPKHISFSLFLAMAVEDYVRGSSKVTNSKYPRLMDRMDMWNDCIEDMKNDDLIRINERVSQLANKIRKEINTRL
tara:strand:- start:530 stop:829 length:300 start_codon:yes stop_codon:yes gene_type:complete